MNYKRIAVHLDNTDRSDARLHLAVDLASRFGAQLVGLFAECDPYLANLASRRPTDMFREPAERAEAIFRASTEQKNIGADWRTAVVRRDSALTDALVAECRLSDIAILGQFQPGMTNSGVPADLAERVVLRAGRPLLVIPFAGDHARIGRRIVIAWNGSREAARALNDAMPFLVEAADVIITAIVPLGRNAARNEDICARIARYLQAHGVEPKTETLVAEKGWTMDALLSRVADHGADLLVMGAHGNVGPQDLPRGSGTQHLLNNMTVPALISF
jgi:nucleotide-binding universal stress UspA family protein